MNIFAIYALFRQTRYQHKHTERHIQRPQRLTRLAAIPISYAKRPEYYADHIHDIRHSTINAHIRESIILFTVMQYCLFAFARDFIGDFFDFSVLREITRRPPPLRHPPRVRPTPFESTALSRHY